MLYGEPKGFFARTFLLKDEKGVLGSVGMASFKEAGTAVVGTESYTFRREKPRRGKFVMLNESGEVIVYAEKPSAWKDRFVVTFGTMEFELFLTSRWKHAFAFAWKGEIIGRVDHLKFFSRRATIDLPESLPVQVRAFIFWLVLVMWQRYAAAAAS